MTKELRKALRAIIEAQAEALGRGVALPFSTLAALVAAEAELPLSTVLRAAFEAGLDAEAA